MSASSDRQTIERILTEAGGWVHRYTLSDHPDLQHLTYGQLGGDLRWLRQHGRITKRKTCIRSRRAPAFMTHEYSLSSLVGEPDEPEAVSASTSPSDNPGGV